MEEKRWDCGKIAVVLCVFLLGLNLWQGTRLIALEQRIFEVQRHITNDIQDLGSSLLNQVREEERLVQNWNYTSSVNMEKRCLNLAVSFILKEWKEDTGAELLWAGDGGTVGEGSAPLTGDGKGTFTGVLEIPLDRGRLEFTLALITRDGEDERRENLDGVYDTGELLPVQCGFQGEQVEYLKGVFTVYECEADLYGRAETEGHVFRLRRNDEIVMEQAAEPGDRSNRYFCGKLSSEAQPGDQMALTFFCRDENGLGYEFMLRNWIAVEERDVARGSSEWEDWLKLTWD